MTRALAILILFASWACGAPQQKDRVPATETLSAAEHMEEAQRHEREAASHESLRSGDSPSQPSAVRAECADTETAGVPTSGGERLPLMSPCWTSTTSPDAHHIARAEQHRKWSEQHRSRAADLLGAEKRACTGLGEDARTHSPFFYAQDIADVTELKRGVRVTFRNVKGLSLDFMERSIRCHQARSAAMGYSTTFMPWCPLSLQRVKATANLAPDGRVVVVLESDDQTAAAAVAGRMRDLLDTTKE